MTVTPGHLTISSVRQPVASAFTSLAVITNTGTAAVRVITADGDVLANIAANGTAEIKPQGRTIYAVAEAPTAVEVARYSVADLRADASEEFHIPVELIRGRTKAEIADFVTRYYAHEAAE